MGLIRNQNDFLVFKVIIGKTIFLGCIQSHVQTLNSRENNVYVIGIDTLEVFNFTYGNPLVAKTNSFSEQIFLGHRVQEVVSGLLNDVAVIHEEQKIPVPLFIEIGNQTSHHQGFATACCHVEEQLVILTRLAIKSLFPVVLEKLKGSFLIGAHRESRIQVTSNGIW